MFIITNVLKSFHRMALRINLVRKFPYIFGQIRVRTMHMLIYTNLQEKSVSLVTMYHTMNQIWFYVQH